jgi:hypothetical protein
MYGRCQSSEAYVNDGDEHVRIDKSPDELDDRIQPLDTLGRGRGVLLRTLHVHIHPHALELLLDLPPCILRADPRDRCEGGEEAGAPEKGEPADAAAGGDEEPGDGAEGRGDARARAQDRLCLGDVDDLNGGREGLQADVAHVCDRGRREPVVLARGVPGLVERGPGLAAGWIECFVVKTLLPVIWYGEGLCMRVCESQTKSETTHLQTRDP